MIKIEKNELERVKIVLKGKLKQYLELRGARFKRGRSYCCFIHDDSEYKAGLTDDEQGYRCFKCGATGDVIEAYAHLEQKDITGQNYFYAIRDLATILGVPLVWEEVKEISPKSEYQKTEKMNEYIYTDLNGVPGYMIERHHVIDEDRNVVFKDNCKPKKVFFARKYNDGKWAPGMEGVERNIYRWHRVGKSIVEGNVILFVEGEKSVEYIEETLGLVATTIAYGANAWKEPYSERYATQLEGAYIVLIPDHDESGYSFMKKVSSGLRGKVKSLKIVTLNDIIQLPKGGDIVDWVEQGGTKEQLLDAIAKASEQAQEKETWYAVDEKGRKKLVVGKLADHMVQSYPAIMTRGFFYLYRNGVYEEVSDHAIRAMVKQKISPDLQKMHQIRDVEGLWKSDHRLHKSLDELNADLNIINVRNGLYDVQKNQLIPHSKEIYSTVQLDVNYNPSASGEVFTRFLNHVVPDPDTQLLLQEMSGYAMSQRHCAKKFFMLIGPRDSGKTTFLNILNSLLGQNNVSSVAFQNIGDRFATAVLFGKTANISTETPDAGIQDV